MTPAMMVNYCCVGSLWAGDLMMHCCCCCCCWCNFEGAAGAWRRCVANDADAATSAADVDVAGAAVAVVVDVGAAAGADDVTLAVISTSPMVMLLLQY